MPMASDANSETLMLIDEEMVDYVVSNTPCDSCLLYWRSNAGIVMGHSLTYFYPKRGR